MYVKNHRNDFLTLSDQNFRFGIRYFSIFGFGVGGMAEITKMLNFRINFTDMNKNMNVC